MANKVINIQPRRQKKQRLNVLRDGAKQIKKLAVLEKEIEKFLSFFRNEQGEVGMWLLEGLEAMVTERPVPLEAHARIRIELEHSIRLGKRSGEGLKDAVADLLRGVDFLLRHRRGWPITEAPKKRKSKRRKKRSKRRAT